MIGRDDGKDRAEFDRTTASRDEQAAYWCLRMAEGGLLPAERQELDAWLVAADNRRAFEDALSVWQCGEERVRSPELIDLRSRALKSLHNASRHRWRARRRGKAAGWALAASLVAALGAVWLVQDPLQVYETGVGERRLVVLEDGSRLSLDAASRVEVRMGRRGRDLRLRDGRARFDVAKDALRPFSVAVDDKLVVAVGTSFSVERVQHNMHVILFEGRVEVLQKEGSDLSSSRERHSPLRLPASQRLKPGQELVLDLATNQVAAVDEVLAPRPETPVQETGMRVSTHAAWPLSWEAGQLDFSGEPLASAVERMNRYTHRRLVVRDPAVGRMRVNGVFIAGDTLAFVEGVTRLLPVDAVEGDTSIELVRRPTFR